MGQALQPLAVVTGASSGIGLELARIFAKNKFDLLIAAENDKINDVTTELRSLGGRVESAQLDLAKAEGVDALYAKIKSLGVPVEAIAINAGVGVGGEFIKNNFQDELNMLNLNVISLVHLTKHVLRDLVGQKRGRILFTSSVAGTMPGPYYAVYAATKAFVQSFSEAIRVEVKDSGVTVTALQPGATDTNFFARAHMLDTKAGEAKKDDPAKVAQQGFDAMMAGKDHVVAGSFMNKVETKIANLVTEPMGAAMQGKQIKPKSVP